MVKVYIPDEYTNLNGKDMFCEKLDEVVSKTGTKGQIMLMESVTERTDRKIKHQAAGSHMKRS